MLLGRKKFELKRLSFIIHEDTPIYYPIPKGGDKYYSDPEYGEVITYTPEGIPHNCYEVYKNEETGISIIIFSIGKSLYIKPDFWGATERELSRAGFKRKKMNTPFSCGAIPTSIVWNEYYRSQKLIADAQFHSFEMEFLGEKLENEE